LHTLTVKFREALEDVIGCRNDEGAGAEAALSRGPLNPFARVDFDNSNSLAGNNTNGEDPVLLKSITKLLILLSGFWQFTNHRHYSCQCRIAGHLSELFVCVGCVGVCVCVCGVCVCLWCVCVVCVVCVCVWSVCVFVWCVCVWCVACVWCVCVCGMWRVCVCGVCVVCVCVWFVCVW